MERKVLIAPDSLCLYDKVSITPTLSFFNQINQISLIERHPLILDLSQLRELTAAASVLLFATVNISQLWAAEPKHIIVKPPNSKSNCQGYNLVVKSGLSKALNSGSLTMLDELSANKAYFQSSVTPDVQYQNTIEMLTRNRKLTDAQMNSLTTAISEAMLNVGHHAYKDPRGNNKDKIDEKKTGIVEKVGERWWQCAWFNKHSSTYVFIICDLGVSIPCSFAQLSFCDYLASIKAPSEQPNMPNELAESEFVKSSLLAALTEGNSRFSREGRGNGSEDIKRGVSVQDREKLLIYSGSSCYAVDAGNEPRVDRLPTYFEGTLIQWTLCTE